MNDLEGGIAVAAVIGAVAGVHAATWGMYKDALYEGFSPAKYARSIIVGAAAGAIIEASLHLDMRAAGGLVLVFGLAYVLERGAVEWHKSFIRDEDQSKYFIPMAFAVNGRVVASRAARFMAGVLYAACVSLVVLGVTRLERTGLGAWPVSAAMLVGSIGGWISAFGGAWKDAPKEGFQPLKFLRSPALSAVYGLAMGALTTSFIAIAFGALGFTIATIETHKKFDRPHEAPGKFAGKPLAFPAMLEARRVAVPVHATLWILILGTLVAALSDASGGLVPARLLAVMP
jgi:hypothetical protein